MSSWDPGLDLAYWCHCDAKLNSVYTHLFLCRPKWRESFTDDCFTATSLSECIQDRKHLETFSDVSSVCSTLPFDAFTRRLASTAGCNCLMEYRVSVCGWLLRRVIEDEQHCRWEGALTEPYRRQYFPVITSPWGLSDRLLTFSLCS